MVTPSRIIVTTALCLLTLRPACGQTAEEVFKNIQVLKGVPVNEFMGTMGVFSAALGMSCEDCHAANDSKWENYAADTSERKRTARRMIAMMFGINKAYFGGKQVVTCYSCHRGGDHPKATVSLGALYGAPPDDDDEMVQQAPDAPFVDQLFEKYVVALGGAERLAKVSSFVAKGSSSGYGPESDRRPIEIFAVSPRQRTVVIHTANGDSTTTYDGRSGWIAAPLRPVAVVPLTGGELEGAKLDAELTFPGRIKESLGQWRVGRPVTIDNHKVQVVQGTSASGNAIATLYFDMESGLLVRLVRYASSPVGRMPTQYDYSDYREVSGVKVPFRWTMTWLDGRETVELIEVRSNVAIDPARFAKPKN
ncbi:MAG TPA: c-type cytochrome [Bryobacteraceae bacterium]|jgi:photosynthetic reaction center cytochrome c subunit|nr:c-type cytochrome [Bryobacteraceae bacterium]